MSGSARWSKLPELRKVECGDHPVMLLGPGAFKGLTLVRIFSTGAVDICRV